MDFSFLDQPVDRPTHPAALDEEALMKQCTLTRGRASGPGGQHRNKVETHITLVHNPTGVEAQAGERRLAKENQRVALKRLRLCLATQVRVEVPQGEIRSELWKSRCRNRKIVCSTKHADFPSLLAEALDVIDACGYDTRKASIRLECTGTQLLRLVAEHPPALVKLNDERRLRSMRPLRP
ncbi:MAG: peptide chain release factor-like protein [Phycisphaerae bacterium]|mgnify:CR=1 FL=1|nr:peptide chain release factor-like protein [Phycisphaerae bacterium]